MKLMEITYGKNNSIFVPFNELYDFLLPIIRKNADINKQSIIDDLQADGYFDEPEWMINFKQEFSSQQIQKHKEELVISIDVEIKSDQVMDLISTLEYQSKKQHVNVAFMTNEANQFLKLIGAGLKCFHVNRNGIYLIPNENKE